jgi:hypothetical protein
LSRRYDAHDPDVDGNAAFVHRETGAVIIDPTRPLDEVDPVLGAAS